MAEQVYKSVAYDGKNTQLSIVIKGTTVDGKPVPQKSLAITKGWSNLEYTTTINREKYKGGNRIAEDRTEGDADHTASLTASRSTWQLIRKTAQSMKIPLAYIEMDMTIKVKKGQTDGGTDTLHRVALQEIGATLDNTSTAPTEMTMPLDPMNIFYDGEDVFGEKLG